MKAETEQKAIPTVCARSSPAVDSGSHCNRQQSSGKASVTGFLKRGSENLPLPELASPVLLAHSDDRVGGKVQTHRSTQAFFRLEPTLCSPCMCRCIAIEVKRRGRAAYLSACCSADTLWCSTWPCLSDDLCLRMHMLHARNPP